MSQQPRLQSVTSWLLAAAAEVASTARAVAQVDLELALVSL